MCLAPFETGPSQTQLCPQAFLHSLFVSERKTVAARSEKSGVTVSCLLDDCKKLMRCVGAAVAMTLGVVSVFHGHAGSRCFDNVQGRAVAAENFHRRPLG